MRLSVRLCQQLKFNFKKHFIQNPNIKTHTMETLGFEGDKRFGYCESFQLLDQEACNYIRKLTENQDFVKKTKRSTDFSPFVMRNLVAHDQFLWDIFKSKDAENYFSEIVGEEVQWIQNTWHAAHMNVQEEEGLDVKVFDWHVDGQPMTLIVNISDMPEKVLGGSTEIRQNDGTIVELKQLGPGKLSFDTI